MEETRFPSADPGAACEQSMVVAVVGVPPRFSPSVKAFRSPRTDALQDPFPGH